MVMSQVLYTGTNAARAKQFSHSLQAVVKRELKRDLDKSEQDGDWADEDLTPEQIHYAARDAHVLPDLAETLLAKIERAGLRDVYELERRVSYAVDAMQRNGFAINEARLAPLVEEVTADAERLKAELEAECLTLHAYELAALIAAARLVAQKGEEELPEEAAEQLRQVLASYDEASRRPDAAVQGG
jgi:DNA polymerase I-like protein with 3'-5' exonuclease and polymerase domains